MANICLELIPNRLGALSSTLGRPLLGEAGRQQIEFPVRVAKRWYLYGESNIHLATGEQLKALEGNATLYRGKHLEDGKPLLDIIGYRPSFAGDSSVQVLPSSAAYYVKLYLDDRLFDQVVSLGRASGLPWINLYFDFMRGGISYGDAPDGSETMWNNREHEIVDITAATLVIPLADQNDDEDSQRGELPPAPELSPPTQVQLDRRFRETRELLIQIGSSLSLLKWAVFGVAAILIVARFL